MAATTGEHELSSNQSPLKGAVLGLLVQGPSYGYELANRLERQLGPGWSIVRPSLYRMLRGLDREGLVSSSQASEDTSSARIMYEATDLAESALIAWMDSPLSFDEAQLQLQARMVVARPEDLPRLLVALNQHERALFSKRDQVQAGTPAQHSLRAAMMFLVREASMQRINGELLWLDLARQTIRTLLASRNLSAADGPVADSGASDQALRGWPPRDARTRPRLSGDRRGRLRGHVGPQALRQVNLAASNGRDRAARRGRDPLRRSSLASDVRARARPPTAPRRDRARQLGVAHPDRAPRDRAGCNRVRQRRHFDAPGSRVRAQGLGARGRLGLRRRAHRPPHARRALAHGFGDGLGTRAAPIVDGRARRAARTIGKQRALQPAAVPRRRPRPGGGNRLRELGGLGGHLAHDGRLQRRSALDGSGRRARALPGPSVPRASRAGDARS